MDKYAFLVFLLASGFIASTTAVFCGNFPNKHSEFGLVMRYFSYSFFCLLLIAQYVVVRFYDYTYPLDCIGEGLSSGAVLEIYTASIIISVGVGLLWSLMGRKMILSLLNKARCLVSGSYMEVKNGNRPIDDLFGDDKQHFVIVTKGGEIKSVGFFGGVSDPSSDDMEIYVFDDPVYRSTWEAVQSNPEDHPLKHRVQTYFNLDKDIIITEYEFPEDWGKVEE